MRVFLLIAALLVACGDETPAPPIDLNNIPDMAEPDQNTEDMDTPDTPQPDMAVNPDEGCSSIRDIGVISEDGFLERRLEEPKTGHTTSCQTEDASSGSTLYKFEVEVPMKLTITADALPRMVGEIVIPPAPSLELREGSCSPEANEDALCTSERRSVWDLVPGTPYYLAINGEIESNGVRLALETSELICSEADNVCVEGSLQNCVSGQRLDTYACADGCAGTECAGNTCGSELSVAGSGTHRITGATRAYADSWNAVDHPTCAFEAGSSPENTQYADFVVKLEDVAAGTEILVSSENDQSSGNYGYFFSTSCEADTCEFAGFADEFGFNEVRYTTEEGGDLFLRIESLQAASVDFAIDITFNP